MTMSEITWLNKDSRTFLARGYLLPGVTPEARMRQIAEHAEAILAYPGFADRFESYLHKGWFSLASPIWSNFGAGRGLPISCFGLYCPDTMDGILSKVAEVGMESKHGGGTSGYFGAVRARGAPINSGGKSSGAVHFMELFDKVTTIVSQSNVRRGQFAAYLPVDHQDIMEFFTIRDEDHEIQDMSIGVTISDAWMESMIAGDKAKRKVWSKIIEKRCASGYPYLFFSDTVNRSAPQAYQDSGKIIWASNLCVTGDTIVEVCSADEDPVSLRIRDLGFYLSHHKEVQVKSYDINSRQVVHSEILAFAQTGESTDLMEIEDEKGNVLLCTPEHKVYTKNRGYVEAQFLQETDVLENSG